MNVPVWKLIRNPYGRALYDLLGRLGVRFSKFYLYAVDLSAVDPPKLAPPPDVHVGVEVGTVDVDAPTLPDASTEDADAVVTAAVDGAVVGVQYLSVDREVYVEYIEDTVTFEGAYLWGLYVAPAYRRAGVATTLVARALRLATDEFDAVEARALVGVDNTLSQRVMAANGLAPVREWSYYRLLGLERRIDRPLER